MCDIIYYFIIYFRSAGVSHESGCGSMEGVEEALERLVKKREGLETVWTGRKLRLDLLLQLRLFQRDSVEVSGFSVLLVFKFTVQHL